MAKYAHTMMLPALLLLGATPLQAEDYNGEWIATVTDSHSNCEDIGKDILGEYLVAISADDTRVTIQGKGEKGITYVGAFNPKNPNRVKLNTTYTEEGGYVTELVDMQFTGKDSGEGGVIFRFSDEYYSCGGSFAFTLKRK